MEGGDCASPAACGSDGKGNAAIRTIYFDVGGGEKEEGGEGQEGFCAEHRALVHMLI